MHRVKEPGHVLLVQHECSTATYEDEGRDLDRVIANQESEQRRKAGIVDGHGEELLGR